MVPQCWLRAWLLLTVLPLLLLGAGVLSNLPPFPHGVILVLLVTLTYPQAPYTFILLSYLLAVAIADDGLLPLSTLLTLQGLSLVLGLLLSHLSTHLLLPLAVGTEATEVDVAAFEEALRTQLSKLVTNVSSPPPQRPTPQLAMMLELVEGDAALYSAAEVICLLIGMMTGGAGETEEDEQADAVREDEDVSSSSCCCCCGTGWFWRERLALGRDTTTK